MTTMKEYLEAGYEVIVETMWGDDVITLEWLDDEDEEEVVFGRLEEGKAIFYEKDTEAYDE